MAAVCGQRSVAGICHHLGSLLRGADGACLLRIAGMPAGWAGCRQLSCSRLHTAVVRRRWWHGCMWPASPPAGGFAMGRVPGQGSGMQDGARCVSELLQPHTSTSSLLPPCPIPGLACCLPRIAGGSC